VSYSVAEDDSWEYLDGVLTYAEVDLDAEVGVSFYKITYTTVDLSGNPTTASGCVAVPDGRTSDLKLVSYQHSTNTEKSNVPSSVNDEATFIGAAYASSGKYVVTMADYLGLGVNPGLHPYMHAASEASASVDAIRAGRALCKQLGVELNGDVFLAGYSQGGHATMALSQAIQTSYASEFNVVASAPMSGPYDLSNTQLHFALDDPGQDTNVFLAYVTLAYDMVYGIYTNPNQAFSPPWDTKVPTLFNGTNDITAVQQALPGSVTKLFQPAFLAEMTQAGKPLQADLQLNDLWNWKPMMPMTIYAARSDEIVAFYNAQKAFDTFTANGAPNVHLVDLGGNLTHVNGIEPAVYDARIWFDSF
jgi:predicted esterase